MLKYKFVEYRKIAYVISLVVILIGIFSLATQGLNLGIDFTGGTRLHLDLGEDFEVAEVRKILAQFDLEGSQIQKAGSILNGEEKEVAIKTISLSEQERNDVISAFQSRWTQMDEEKIGIESVGPTMGEELRRQAFWALIIAITGMVIYITLRFEFKFAVAAIIALLHDALIVLTVFSLLQIEVNGPFVAAVLTIIGYSINDTIVLFDRIRENLKGRTRADFSVIINQSINQTIVRSINTSATTLVVLIALFIFGGIALQPFITALLVGVISGTYSSIFVASQLWFSWKQYQLGRNSAQTA